MTTQPQTAAETPTVAWRKSNYTQANGQCVELAALAGQIAVRDSKDPHGPMLLFRPASFAAFLNKTKAGKPAI
jgi:Domain of unknown function (DUF397)